MLKSPNCPMPSLTVSGGSGTLRIGLKISRDDPLVSFDDYMTIWKRIKDFPTPILYLTLRY